MIKAQRQNLCAAVRDALTSEGYSSYLVLNAVNAELGKLNSKGAESVLADSKAKEKNAVLSVTQSTKENFTGAMTMPGFFDVWSCAVGKLNKLATTPVVLPRVFTDGSRGKGEGWLQFAHKATLEQEQKEQPAEVS